MFLLFQISKFWKNRKHFETVFWFHKKLFVSKSFELEFFKNSDSLMELQFDFRLKGIDHAGPSITVVFFGLGFGAKIYDHRHWDYRNNKWENK